MGLDDFFRFSNKITYSLNIKEKLTSQFYTSQINSNTYFITDTNNLCFKRQSIFKELLVCQSIVND